MRQECEVIVRSEEGGKVKLEDPPLLDSFVLWHEVI